MKVCCGVVAGLLLLCSFCPPARAGAEIYLLGGPSFDNLIGDADAYGTAIARIVGREYSGFWTSERAMRVGPDVGLGCRYEIASGLAVAAEVRYLVRGTEWHLTEQTELARHLDSSLDFKYLEIPVLAQYSLPVRGRVRPVLLAGPVLGVRLSTKLAFRSPGFTAPEGDFGPGLMKSSYLSAVAGVGVRVHTSGRSTLLAQARIKAQSPNLMRDWVGLQLKPQDFSVLLGFSRAL